MFINIYKGETEEDRRAIVNDVDSGDEDFDGSNIAIEPEYSSSEDENDNSTQEDKENRDKNRDENRDNEGKWNDDERNGQFYEGLSVKVNVSDKTTLPIDNLTESSMLYAKKRRENQHEKGKLFKMTMN